MIHEGDPRYSLCQDLIEGDGPTQDAASARLVEINALVQQAQDVAEALTWALLPQELIDAGYHFAFETSLCPNVNPATGLLCSQKNRHDAGHVYSRRPQEQG